MNKDDKKKVNDLISNLTVNSEYKNELYTILIPLIFSKKFFKKGIEIKVFLDSVMGLQFSEYVYKSRTILAGKIVKHLNNLGIEECIDLHNKLMEVIVKVISTNENTEEQSNSGKRNKKSSSFFSSWNNSLNSKE